MEHFIIPFSAEDFWGKLLCLDAEVSYFSNEGYYLPGNIYINPAPHCELQARFSLTNLNLVISIESIRSDTPNCWHGTLMLNSLLSTVEYLEQSTGYRCNIITGWLSPIDKADGRWKKSLPFYQNFPQHNTSHYGISCLFENKETGRIYADYSEFMEESSDGRVIFTLMHG